MKHPKLDEELLTRYVLGELDKQEAAAVKEALIANPEARKTVEELEQTIGLLADAFGAEDAPELEAGQREGVEHAAGSIILRRPLRRRYLWIASLAATVALVCGIGFLYAGAIRTVHVGYSGISDYETAQHEADLLKQETHTPEVPTAVDALRYAKRDDEAASAKAPAGLRSEAEEARQAGQDEGGRPSVAGVAGSGNPATAKDYSAMNPWCRPM